MTIAEAGELLEQALIELGFKENRLMNTYTKEFTHHNCPNLKFIITITKLFNRFIIRNDATGKSSGKKIFVNKDQLQQEIEEIKYIKLIA